MKYLKEYWTYDNEIVEICEKYSIHNWSIRDGLVDVDDDVHLNYKNLSKLPLKFGRVSGYFTCSNNQLTTLEGAPNWVGSNFYFSYNKLTTLEGGPKSVGGDFWCSYNNLTTIEGCPKWVNGDFGCSNNKLTTLEHFPNVEGDIHINNNLLPKEIYDNEKHLKQIIELQDEYDIWRDGRLYLPRFRELLKDIN